MIIINKIKKHKMPKREQIILNTESSEPTLPGKQGAIAE